MTTLNIKVPGGKESSLPSYVRKTGGEVVKETEKTIQVTEAESEVTHEFFWGKYQTGNPHF